MVRPVRKARRPVDATYEGIKGFRESAPQAALNSAGGFGVVERSSPVENFRPTCSVPDDITAIKKSQDKFGVPSRGSAPLTFGNSISAQDVSSTDEQQALNRVLDFSPQCKRATTV